MLESGKKTCEDCTLFEQCKKIGDDNKCVMADVAHDLGLIAKWYNNFVRSNRLVSWMFNRYRRKHKPSGSMRWTNEFGESDELYNSKGGMIEQPLTPWPSYKEAKSRTYPEPEPGHKRPLGAQPIKKPAVNDDFENAVEEIADYPENDMPKGVVLEILKRHAAEDSLKRPHNNAERHSISINNTVPEDVKRKETPDISRNEQQDREKLKGIETDTLIEVIKLHRCEINAWSDDMHWLDTLIMKTRKRLVMYQDELETRFEKGSEKP